MSPTMNATAALAAALLAAAGPAGAAASRVWVSGHGVDQAGCGAPTAPCRSLQYAHDHAVSAGGEIDILDPAGYGAIAITKSISIVNDGVGTAGVQSTSGIAVNINAGPTDTIYLRGLNIDGVGFAGLSGVQFNSGASLSMANCVVRHFSAYGIALAPTGLSAAVGIVDTVSSDNHGGGILVRPVSTSAGAAADVVINGVTAHHNGGDTGFEQSGITVDGGSMNGQLGVFVSNTNASNNIGDGLLNQSTSDALAMVSIDRSQFDANAAGIHGESHSVTFLSNSTAFGNRVADMANAVGNGAFNTYGNNMYYGLAGQPLSPLSPQ
jgi:hypothetical protein